MKFNNICTRLQECNKEQLCLRLYGADLHSDCNFPPCSQTFIGWHRLDVATAAARSQERVSLCEAPTHPCSFSSSWSRSRTLRSTRTRSLLACWHTCPARIYPRRCGTRRCLRQRNVAKTADHIPKNQNSDEERFLIQLQTLKIDTSKRQQ